MTPLKNITLISILTLMTQSALAEKSTSETIRHVKTSEKVVALTFDDGPSEPYTQQILDVLNKNNVKGTFYILGGNAKEYPKIIKQIMNDGHELGSHSMNHTMMKNRSVDAIYNDLSSVDTILRNLGYQKEITFRAPFGITSDNLRTALAKLNKRQVLFTFLAQDWTKISAQQIHDNVMKQLKPGLIIVLHDGGKRRENTVKATQMLIDSLKQQGYRIVSISELLSLQDQKKVSLHE